MKLLSIGGNTKIRKSDKQGEYLTAIMHLSPARLSGKEFCAGRSQGCTASCLNESGRGFMKSVQKARLEKSKLFVQNRNLFITLLKYELKLFENKCKRLGVKPAVRLNGTSDLPWEKFDIMQSFPNIQFYDYTAVAVRFSPTWRLPENYHLTFSLKEHNKKAALEVLGNGGNVAVVFRNQLPDTWNGYKVVNGDITDLRFKDESNVIIGLTAKGKAKHDTTGFVQE